MAHELGPDFAGGVFTPGRLHARRPRCHRVWAHQTMVAAMQTVALVIRVCGAVARYAVVSENDAADS